MTIPDKCHAFCFFRLKKLYIYQTFELQHGVEIKEKGLVHRSGVIGMNASRTEHGRINEFIYSMLCLFDDLLKYFICNRFVSLLHWI